MIRRHYRLNVYEPETLQETAKDSEAWRGAVHEVRKEDMTERLNNNYTFCS